MNILLLEDNSTDIDLTKLGLLKSIPNCNIHVATSTKQARSFFSKGMVFDVALLDVKLPDGNGLDILMEIRQKGYQSAVIILTGSGDEEVAVTALKAGANDYVIKRGDYIDHLPNVIKLAIERFRHTSQIKAEIINVLYIEPHSTDIDLTDRHLSQYAPYIHLHSVHTQDEALSLLSGKTPFQVILMDYSLSGANAFELIKTIRQKLVLDIPIILVTGQGNEEIAVQGLKIGANDYLTKNEKYLFRLPSLILNAYQHSALLKKRAALEESEARYRLLAENSGDVIFVLDMDLNYTYISPAVKALRGVNQEEAKSQKLSNVLTPESYQKAIKAVQQLNQNISKNMPTVKPQLLELEMIRKDSSTVWTEVKASLIMNDKNEPIGILGVTRDISARKMATEELRKLSQAVKQSPASVVITDTLGNIEYVNPKFTLLTGYSLQEVLGKNPRFLKSDHTSPEEYVQLWKTIESGNEWRGEFQNKRKNGSLYWEQASISSIRDAENRITHYLAVKEDITEKKRIVDELIHAKNLAEESSRLKSAFLANISHEIRTPLNGIMGFTHLLQNPDLTSESRDMYFNILLASGERMLSTINDIIEMSQIEARRVALNITEVNITKLIDYYYNFFKPEVEKKGLVFNLVNGLEKEPLIIRTDKNKLESIISNLLKNAIKFTSKGNIEFGVNTKNTMLNFYVKDTGIGVPKNKIESIFNRFEQADTSYPPAYEGSGLGLSISQSHAIFLGGNISVESEEGKGSTFKLSLPLKTTSSRSSKNDIDIPLDQIKSNGELILVVEDDEINFTYISELLKDYNFQILHSKTGENAINLCLEHPDISLILMDVKLPAMSGYETTQKIKAFMPMLPIIAQTAFASEQEKAKALSSGCVDYISKPFNEKTLLLKIKEHI
jgi:PAS domain S-box-containing protein